METHEEKKIRIRDVEITYVAAGSGPNAVLLLPGALGSYISDMLPQFEGLPLLLPNHSIIAWNVPGMGSPEKYHLDFLQEDAELANEFMQKLGYKTYSLVGWCNGGLTGIVISALYPDAVDKLVVCGARSYVTEHDVAISEGLRDMNNWSEKMRERPEAIYGKELAQEIWSGFCDTLLDTFKQRNGNFCVDKLSQVQCPTFILHGAEDILVAPEHVPFLQNNIPDAQVYIFPEGKHNIHLRYPEEFNDLVAKFLLQQ